jgi:hypothetical protein
MLTAFWSFVLVALILFLIAPWLPMKKPASPNDGIAVPKDIPLEKLRAEALDVALNHDDNLAREERQRQEWAKKQVTEDLPHWKVAISKHMTRRMVQFSSEHQFSYQSWEHDLEKEYGLPSQVPSRAVGPGYYPTIQSYVIELGDQLGEPFRCEVCQYDKLNEFGVKVDSFLVFSLAW